LKLREVHREFFGFLLQSSKLVLCFGDSVRIFKSRFQNDDQSDEISEINSIVTNVEKNLIKSVITKKRNSETKMVLNIEMNEAAESKLSQKRAKLISFVRERLELENFDGEQGGRAAGFGRLSIDSGLSENSIGVLKIVDLKLADVVRGLSLFLQIDLFLSVDKKIVELLLSAESGGERNREQGTNVSQIAYDSFQKIMKVSIFLAGLLGDIVHKEFQVFDVDVEKSHVEKKEERKEKEQEYKRD
jgi:hypothetical protein